MNAQLAQRLAEAADSLELAHARFERLNAQQPLVMGTPGFTITVATYAVISSIFITSTQTGGSKTQLAEGNITPGDGASLTEILALHEAELAHI
jgi:hypothetical protein